MLKISVVVGKDIKHFCYINSDLKKRFDGTIKEGIRTLSNLEGKSMTDFIKAWALKDFGIEIETIEDLVTLKTAIKEKYKVLYPELYLESTGDYQGWSRLWVTKKMQEVIENA